MVQDDLTFTPLYELHVELGAKMVPFAGWSMPVQYPLGVMKEHLFCRENAGLFDVSHMGQVLLSGPDVAQALETLIPQAVIGLREGRQRYGFFTNEDGGIEDDLMFANRGDHIYMVVNAACADDDIARLKWGLEPLGISVTPVTDRALIALQGPKAEDALAVLNPAVRDMNFMDVADIDLCGVTAWVSRSGYTGEDGFEISIPDAQAEDLARALLELDSVQPIGLGARDSLRLEAGLCLYGHDMDAKTTPVQAALGWGIQKSRRTGGARAGDFPGAARVLQELETGADICRVGLLPQGRAPMREGVQLFETEDADTAIGHITSGGFGPSVGAPVAMGYVPTRLSQPATILYADLRGRRLPVTVSALPFVPARFKRAPSQP